jgi:hypothetical protein
VRNRSSHSVHRTMVRVLTFRITRVEFQELDYRHLVAGLLSTWIVGMGRYWNAADATLAQRMGAGSLLFVVAFSGLVWLVLRPLKPGDWSYRRVLTLIALVSPPAILYAIPVEQLAGSSRAVSIRVGMLALVAGWRVSLLVYYVVKLSGWRRPTALIGSLIPITAMIAALSTAQLIDTTARDMARLEQNALAPAAFVSTIHAMANLGTLLFVPIMVAYVVLRCMRAHAVAQV